MPKGAWMLGTIGPLIMLLGVYVAGGSDVVCTRVGAPAESSGEPGQRVPVVGSCQVQTKRWLGRTTVSERTYPHITAVDRTTVPRTETSTDSKGRSTSRTVNDWSLQLMNDGVEVDRVGAARDEVAAAYNKGQAWFDGNAASSLTLDFSDWPFAYAAIGFGTLWLGVIALMTRAASVSSRFRSGLERTSP
jgi:hypothetical protein